MISKNSKLVVLSGFILGLVVLSCWVFVGSPKKEIVFIKMFGKYDKTGETGFAYEVFYEWNGVKQEVPWWFIFEKDGKWLVVETKDISIPTDKNVFRYAEKFDHTWIWDYGFTPQPTRYQTMLMMVGLQPTFSDEKDIFIDILSDIETGGKILEPKMENPRED